MDFSLRQAAQEAPLRLALVADERRWTFRELDQAVEPYRQNLGGQDPTRNPIGLVGERNLPTLLLLYALLDLGIPTILLHPRWTEEETRRALHLSGATGRWTATDAPSPAESLQYFPLAPGSTPSSDKYLAPGSLVVFTSGSSGTPKGTVLSGRALFAAAQASAANLGWQEDDRWLLTMPLAHVGGLSIVTRCLVARRTVVLSQSETFRPDAFIHEVARHRITLASLVPTMLFRLLRDRPRWRPPGSLRAVLLGGAPAAGELLAAAADRNLPILTTYGLTEACSQVATQPPGTVNRGQLGAGPPLPGVEVRIVQKEIQVRGPTLLEGYLGAPGQERPLTADGWFPTGDLGEIDGRGNLHVSGRQLDRIITGGENVDPAEVERVLRQFPGVAEACVFGLADKEWGQIVCAAVVPEEAGTLDGEALKAFLHPRLTSFKGPRRIAFLRELALLPNGKVDRRATAAAAEPHLRSFT